MKRFIICFLFIIILLFSCANRDNKNIVTSKQEQVKTTARTVNVEFNSNQNLLSGFPNIFIDNTKIDLSFDSPDYSLFYNKFAGIYEENEWLEKDITYRNIYAISNSNSSWGTAYHFGRGRDCVRIDYNAQIKCFTISDGAGSVQEITNIDSFTLPSNLTKVSWPNNQDGFFRNIINQKYFEDESLNINRIIQDDEKVRLLNRIKLFFTVLNSEDADAFNALLSKSFMIDAEYENFTITNETNQEEIIWFINNLKEKFCYNKNINYTLYLNSYFSENAAQIYVKHPNSYLIEFKFESSVNYFSLLFINEDQELKIAYIRDVLFMI